MLPKTHILLGALFTILIWEVFPNVQWFYLLLVFLSSFLIDFDHYATSSIKSGRILSLGESYRYHTRAGFIERKEIRRNIRKKGDFHLLHTIEFHLFIFLLGFLWAGFFYIFIGMVFHSLMDLISLTYEGSLHRREFFLVAWIFRKIKQS